MFNISPQPFLFLSLLQCSAQLVAVRIVQVCGSCERSLPHMNERSERREWAALYPPLPALDVCHFRDCRETLPVDALCGSIVEKHDLEAGTAQKRTLPSNKTALHLVNEPLSPSDTRLQGILHLMELKGETNKEPAEHLDCVFRALSESSELIHTRQAQSKVSNVGLGARPVCGEEGGRKVLLTAYGKETGSPNFTLPHS